MKKIKLYFLCRILILSIFTLVITGSSIGQADTSNVVQSDTTDQKSDKKEKKRIDEFIVYAGANINQLFFSSDVYESDTKLGYHLGGAYKRGKYFYWQAGARFNSATFGLQSIDNPTDSTDGINITSIEIPVTGGINFLAFVNRVVALRAFVSAVPSFTVGVGSNELGLGKSDMNSFIFYGQGGIGVDVAFLVFEAGYNYGFNDLLKNNIESKPGQLFINVGFRF